MHNYHKISAPYTRTNSKAKTVDTNNFVDDYAKVLSNKDIWEGTEKVDGTNLNFYYDGNNVTYLGHTDKTNWNPEVEEWIKSKITHEFEQIFEEYFGEKEVIISGELIGPKIQGNLYELTENKFIMFDIYNKTNNTYWDRTKVDEVAARLGFESVPIVCCGTFENICDFVFSSPASKFNPNLEMEGCVVRPVVEMKKNNGERIIYKIKVKDLKGCGARKLH